MNAVARVVADPLSIAAAERMLGTSLVRLSNRVALQDIPEMPAAVRAGAGVAEQP